MPSEHYKQNWDKANEWLHENAPDYVLESVKELADISERLSGVGHIVLDYAEKASKDADTLRDELSKVIKRNKSQKNQDAK